MTFVLDVSWWLVLQVFILPVILPMLVGLATTKMTPGSRQAILLLGLSVITAFLTNLLNAYQSGAAEFDLGVALLTSLVTFVFGVGVHLGLLKPTGTTERLLTSGRTAHVDGAQHIR